VLGFRLVLVLVTVLVLLDFLAVLAVLEFLAVLAVLAVLKFLLVVTSGEGGFRLTPSGIGVTHLGTARRARRRCRCLTAAKG